ncbi:MAG: hypothetical protein JWL82_563 [Parcubacteria group bacterium]|nr:hypothetical protein [Parcubacteria group bacterium]
MMRGTALVAAFLAPLLFPTVLAGIVVFIASVAVPPLGIVIGILTDALYKPASSFPYATLLGAVFSGLGYVMHRFIKTRIISE